VRKANAGWLFEGLVEVKLALGAKFRIVSIARTSTRTLILWDSINREDAAMIATMRRRRSALSDGAAKGMEPAMLMLSSQGFVKLFEGILSQALHGVETSKSDRVRRRFAATWSCLDVVAIGVPHSCRGGFETRP
jgi:hypothetical protein